MARRRLGGVGISLATALLVACAGEPPPEKRQDLVDWYPEPHVVTARRWPDMAVKEFVAMRLPDARNARDDVDERSGRVRFVVNVTAEGAVLFKGSTYDLSEPGALQARGAFRAHLLASTRSRGSAPLMIHAARRAPWRQVSWLLRDTTDIGIVDVQLAAERRDPPAYESREARMDATVSALPDRSPAITATLRRVPADGIAASRVALRLGENAFLFPPDGPWDATFLAEANRAWAEVHGAVRPPPEAAASVRIEIGDDTVPWAYVLKTIDALLGAGWHHVDLPDAGLRLDLLSPPAVPGRESFDHGPPSLGVWALVVACGLAGFLWSWRMARRSSRTRLVRG